MRLLLAKQYLTTSDMSLDGVAFMLGYGETNSFIRAFSLWTGHTPQQFRNHQRENTATG